jgi:hypothetical protein
MEIVRTMERGILGSFMGMLGLVLYNFGRAAFWDIPSVIFAGAAFIALLRRLTFFIFSSPARYCPYSSLG